MKLKITQFHLICIILVQIIIIDSLLIVSFIKVINSRSNSNKVSVVVKNQKNKATPVPKKAGVASHAPKKTQPPTPVPKKAEIVYLASKETQPPTPVPKKVEIKLPATGVLPTKTEGVEKDGGSGQAYLKGFVRKDNVPEGVLQELMSIAQLHNPKPEEMKTERVVFKKGNFVATAYDLSYKCCGKYPSDPQYGITYSGKKATKGRTIAVDTDVIPLGSKVYLEFSAGFSYLNGWYVAEDTGRLVKGRIIDVFFGESASREMEKFGRRRVNVWWTGEH